jgi:hypothetical protein
MRFAVLLLATSGLAFGAPIVSQTFLYGGGNATVLVTSSVFDNFNGDFTRLRWEYTLQNVNFVPPAGSPGLFTFTFPVTSGGASDLIDYADWYGPGTICPPSVSCEHPSAWVFGSFPPGATLTFGYSSNIRSIGYAPPPTGFGPGGGRIAALDQFGFPTVELTGGLFKPGLSASEALFIPEPAAGTLVTIGIALLVAGRMRLRTRG